MAHLMTDGFPNLFLRVQVWAGSRKENDLETRVCLQHFVNRLATMPGSAIPKQDDRDVWIGIQDQLQMLCRSFSIHQVGAHRDFLARVQVQSTVEIGLGSSRIRSDHRRMSGRRPNLAGGGLQVQSGFISSQKERMRCVLGNLYQFFSSCSSKSATFVSLRDLKTFSVFW